MFLRYAAVTLALGFSSGAYAHSWYEPACCSGVDCAPVVDSVVEELADGVHVTASAY